MSSIEVQQTRPSTLPSIPNRSPLCSSFFDILRYITSFFVSESTIEQKAPFTLSNVRQLWDVIAMTRYLISESILESFMMTLVIAQTSPWSNVASCDYRLVFVALIIIADRFKQPPVLENRQDWRIQVSKRVQAKTNANLVRSLIYVTIIKSLNEWIFAPNWNFISLMTQLFLRTNNLPNFIRNSFNYWKSFSLWIWKSHFFWKTEIWNWNLFNFYWTWFKFQYNWKCINDNIIIIIVDNANWPFIIPSHSII